MTVKIVTDSTCDLPGQIIAALEVEVIPLFINIGDEGYLDGVDISREEFYHNLPTYPQHPTTGAPGTQTFLRVYEKLVQQGATEILSIHISESLSATVDVARSAAQQFSGAQVTVVDSGQLSTGTGFQVELAAKMARDGKGIPEILRALEDLRNRTFVTARLSTLEFLRRSGRMNRFMHGLGSLLHIKPILTMQNGQPGSDRVRTTLRAEKRLIDLLNDRLPIERFALLHTSAQDKAEQFKRKIQECLPEGEIFSLDITPVIGVHIGPGAVGFAVVTK